MKRRVDYKVTTVSFYFGVKKRYFMIEDELGALLVGLRKLT
jgi:hypothetical protein